MADANKKYVTKEEMPWEKGSHATYPGAKLRGGNSTVSGGNSVAEGEDNTASGQASHAEGFSTTSSSVGSHSEGVGNNIGIFATGPGAHAEGYEDANSDGQGIVSEGFGSHAEGAVNDGRGIVSSGNGSHAEGYAVNYGTIIANDDGSHAEGYADGAGDDDSDAYISAEGRGAHAEGYVYGEGGTRGHIIAKGYGSHAEGYCEMEETIADGVGSHAEGGAAIAKGDYSHAEGFYCTASGYTSHAEGFSTITQNDAEHAEGKFNKSNKKTNGTYAQKAAGSTLHSVGIGTSANNRKNAFEIMQNGDVYVKGVGEYDGTNAGAGEYVKDLAHFLIYTLPSNEIVVSDDQILSTQLFVSGPNVTCARLNPNIYSSNLRQDLATIAAPKLSVYYETQASDVHVDSFYGSLELVNGAVVLIDGYVYGRFEDDAGNWHYFICYADI